MNDSSMLSNNAYNFLKKVVTIGLPAFSTLYFTLAAIWELPNAEQVVGSLAAVTTFLGVILGISTRSYNNSDARYDGQMNMIQRPEQGSLYSLELNGDPEELATKDEIVFKVVKNYQPE